MPRKKLKPRGKPFESNDPRALATQFRAETAVDDPDAPLPEGEVLAPEGELTPIDPKWPKMLQDMLYVYERNRRAGETPGQRACRRWLADDRRGFMLKLASLQEAVWTSAKAEETKEEAPVETKEDIGTTKALELLEKLLAGFKPKENDARQD